MKTFFLLSIACLSFQLCKSQNVQITSETAEMTTYSVTHSVIVEASYILVGGAAADVSIDKITVQDANTIINMRKINKDLDEAMAKASGKDSYDPATGRYVTHMIFPSDY